MKIFKIILLNLIVFLFNCGVYTFSGSTLPSHIKTVDIPLFANQSLMPNIAEELTQELTKQVISMNLLSVASSKGDATIKGKVLNYSNEPRTFQTSSARQINVSEYVVKITVDVEFIDNKKGSAIYKGKITGEGVYDFKSQTEEIGKKSAEKDVVQQILQNSLQSW
jgi:hypothetical protein